MDRVGGMAIVEGVLLRGPHRWAAASRRPDGTIAVRSGPLPSWSARWSPVPLARGIVALADALSLGVRAVLWSGDLHAPPGKGSGGTAEATRRQLAIALVPGLAITITLVFLLPATVARLLVGAEASTAASFVEAVARIAVLVGYLALVGRLPFVRRVFAYHGAEHKVVALHEAGLPATVDAARTRPVQHGRCGTTFLAIVVAITSAAHLAAAPLHGLPLPTLLGARLLLVPVVAALAYEVLTVAARFPTSPWSRAVLAPGMALQGLTVADPDDDQLEVALVALREALAGAPQTMAWSASAGMPTRATTIAATSSTTFVAASHVGGNTMRSEPGVTGAAMAASLPGRASA